MVTTGINHSNHSFRVNAMLDLKGLRNHAIMKNVMMQNPIPSTLRKL